MWIASGRIPFPAVLRFLPRSTGRWCLANGLPSRDGWVLLVPDPSWSKIVLPPSVPIPYRTLLWSALPLPLWRQLLVWCTDLAAAQRQRTWVPATVPGSFQPSGIWSCRVPVQPVFREIRTPPMLHAVPLFDKALPACSSAIAELRCRDL